MKKLLCLPTAAAMLCACGSYPEDKQNEKYSRSLFCMDTYMTVTAYGEYADAALSEVSSRLQELEKEWSATDSESPIYKADHSAGASVEITADTEELVRFALEMNSRTDGALDITLLPVLRLWGFTTGDYRVPDAAEISQALGKTGASKVSAEGGRLTVPDGMMIDLGAVAKGCAADIAAKLLEEKGVRSAILDLGGNVQTIGLKPDGSEWKIGIRDPVGEGLIGTVSVEDKAVVTSGGYERFFEQDGKTYHHIIDPKTGAPAESGIASVTVVGEEGRMCDALSTSLFVMGADKAYDYWKREGGFEYVIVTDSGELVISAGLKDSFALDGDHYGIKMTVAE